MTTIQNWRHLAAAVVVISAFGLNTVADAATATYMIMESNLINVPSNCGAGSRYNDCGSLQSGFTWADTIPAGSSVNTVTIDVNHGVQCAAATYVFNGSLNGGATSTWMSAAWCSCSLRNDAHALTAPAASYMVAANNTFVMTNPSSCQGYCPNSATLSGSHARVTVDYDAGGGGGAAVPAAGTTSLVVTVILLLGASLLFIGRKAS